MEVRRDLLENKRIRLGIGVILLLGLIFRFANIDRRIYWHDEAFTSLRVSGHLASEILDEFSTQKEISAQYLLKFQKPSPQDTILSTIRSLAWEDPLHPPLYFLINRIWVGVFGYSTSIMRSLAALLSIFVFPGMYLFVVELFKSKRIAILASCLVWVSPIYVLLAREAREYSLWMVFILFANFALLRALRNGTRFDWAVYSIITILGLYTHLLFVFIVFIHGVYVVVFLWSNSELRSQNKKSIIHYFIATTIALIAYIPWILVIIAKNHLIVRSSNWVTVPIPFDIYVQRVIARVSGIFIDLDPFPNLFQGILIFPVIVLIGYSFYYLWNRGSKLSWLFAFLLITLPAGLFVFLDIFSGGYRATISRYLVPCYIGIPLIVAFFLKERLDFFTVRKPNLWLIVIVLLFGLEITSNIFIIQAESWWDKGSDYGYSQMVEIITDSENPLLIIDGQQETHFGYMLALGNEFPSHINIKWGETTFDEVCCQYSDVFVYRPSYETIEALNIEPAFNLTNVIPGLLWRLIKV